MKAIPHGGKLVEKIVDERESRRLIEDDSGIPAIRLETAKIRDVFNICTGVLSPLEGFMDSETLRSVLDEMCLPGTEAAWTIPILLDVDEKDLEGVSEGGEVMLVDESGRKVALMKVSEIFRYDKMEMASKVFGTEDTAHPGVAATMGMKDTFVAGEVEMLQTPSLPFGELTLTPRKTREIFEEKGWETVVGFQTRNVPHVGHEYVQKWALTVTDGLFVNPVIGKKKKGDFRDEVIIAAYRDLMKHYYSPEHSFMSVLHYDMRYAGPREAIMHAIMRKNFGCTHFIVGRDHAGVGNYYGPFEAQEFFDNFPGLGIQPVFFRHFFYCKKCGTVSNEKACPHRGEEILEFSGTSIRKMLTEGTVPPPEMMREEVSKRILSFESVFVE